MRAIHRYLSGVPVPSVPALRRFGAAGRLPPAVSFWRWSRAKRDGFGCAAAAAPSSLPLVARLHLDRWGRHARERFERGGNRGYRADDGLVAGRYSSGRNDAISNPAANGGIVQLGPVGYPAAKLNDRRRADEEIAGIEMMTVSREVVAFDWSWQI